MVRPQEQGCSGRTSQVYGVSKSRVNKKDSEALRRVTGRQ